ncbi:DUF805 domain-containing protein [Leuconostoc litchii]|uniref:DUF805 domain-containing protein n=1 Tax=Leuconostoc litchii TaxID=1981069 RepID=A0A6P2CLP3_9LACO|nr:DUF805 domain-containing protein [Leuconostoc litchii]TYC46910.1 DUF805 domain-containing protein [Leuconostoc litchii]
MRYWREAFDFHSGAYRLDYWWVSAINTLILASILFVSIVCLNSWTLASKLTKTFSLLVAIPNLSLFVRRLRDTGFPPQTVMFVLLSPTLLGVSVGLIAMFHLIVLLPVAPLIYIGWIIFLLSRRSAYWTPSLNKMQKLYFVAGFFIILSVSSCFYAITMKHTAQTTQNYIGQLLHERHTSNQKNAKLSEYDITKNKSSYSSSDIATASAENKPESIPEKDVANVSDDSSTTAYRGLSENTLGDSDFGYFKVRGVWKQDTTSLQWWQSQQNVMISTSTVGQGWGVDFPSFNFKKIEGQSHFSLNQLGNIQVTRIDGSYRDVASDNMKSMAYLEWHMPDGHIRLMYLISPSRALLNLIIKTFSETFQII